jgi:hypothetical protein
MIRTRAQRWADADSRRLGAASGNDHRFSVASNDRVSSDRRRDRRYSMASVISVDDARAITVNLSSTGVYFVTDQPLTAGQQILLVLTFEHSTPAGTRVTCNGRILRVDGRPDGFGVAAAYEPIEFEISSGA